ncbi:hypothetical protein LguiA_001310 [Lonicera macranthoides]
MALAYTIALFASIFLVLQLTAVTSNIISPILSPLFDDVCKEVECGKGKCKASTNSTLPFECECDLGWEKATAAHDDNFKFFPCVIPNCTLNYTCTKAPSPVQQNEKPANTSLFDPCHWVDCGGGTCNKKSPFTYTCGCSEGYFNLLNVSAFPCFRDCALGMDCSSLGIGLMNKSASAQPPSLPASGSRQVSSISRGDFNWLIVAVMSLALHLWK